jgi:hypothetical protein
MFMNHWSRSMARKPSIDDARMLDYDFYELCYKMSVDIAKSNRENEAEDYFGETRMAEYV